jgi:hypothetical protein
MRTIYLFIVLLLAAGIYVLPSTLARFAGTHTMEFNHTGAEALNCVRCHSYILDELNATTASQPIFQKHRTAAGNTTYVTTYLHPNVTNATEFGVCQMCHLAKFYVSAAHTQILVRVCTDPNCHGNNNTINNTLYPSGRMGFNLAQSPNVHQGWFQVLAEQGSPNQNESLANYSESYFTCLGCHTHVQVWLNISQTIFLHNDTSQFGGGPKRYM